MSAKQASVAATSSTTSPQQSQQYNGYAAFEAKGNLKPHSYTPRPFQPFDIDLDITHCGVCHTDIHFINNDWGITKYPVIPGHEVIGTVKTLGPNVKNLKIGTRVGVGPTVGACLTCEDCLRGESNLCAKQVLSYSSTDQTGTTTYGGFADRMRVDSRFVYPIPDELPSETAAPLLCAGITVYSPLKRYAKPKQVVGIIGIGGLGHLALQFSKALGYQTVAFSTSANKEKEAKEFGADYFVDTSKKEETEKWKRSIDFILNTTNVNLDWDLYISLLKPDGRLCFVGVPNGNYSKINIMSLIWNRISVCGSPLGSPQEYNEMFEIAAKQHIVAKTELFKFPDVEKAMSRVRDNVVRYRCVLVADGQKVDAYNAAHAVHPHHHGAEDDQKKDSHSHSSSSSK